MDKALNLLGNVVGGAGVIACALAGSSRLLGGYHLLGFESVTLFIGGIALLVMACLVKLHQLRVGVVVSNS